MSGTTGPGVHLLGASSLWSSACGLLPAPSPTRGPGPQVVCRSLLEGRESPGLQASLSVSPERPLAPSHCLSSRAGNSCRGGGGEEGRSRGNRSLGPGAESPEVERKAAGLGPAAPGADVKSLPGVCVALDESWKLVAEGRGGAQDSGPLRAWGGRGIAEPREGF